MRNIAASMINRPVPLPAALINAMNPSRTPNGALIASEDLQRVAFRFTQKNWSSVLESSWKAFLSGQVSDDLGPHIWSSATKPESLNFDNFFYKAQQVAEANPNSLVKFSLQGGVDQSWSNTNDGVQFSALARYNVYDACPWDLRMSLFAWIDLIARPDVLHFATRLAALPSNYGSAVCLELASVMWALVGAKLWDKDKISFGEWVGGIAAPLYAWEVLWDLIRRGIQQGIDLNKFSGLTCAWKSETEFECQRPMNGLREIRMLDDYLVFRGDLQVPTSGRAELAVSASEFKSILPVDAFSCDSDFPAEVSRLRARPSSWLRASATIELKNQGQLPLFLYQASLLDDGSGMFSVQQEPAFNGFRLTIVFAQNVSALARRTFFLNPYPCKVLVLTSGGARIVTLAPPVEPSTAELDKIIEGAATLAKARCKALTVPRDRSFKLDLLSDPDPRDILRLWEIHLVGLELGTVVQLQDGKGNVLDERTASYGGSLDLFGLSNERSLMMRHTGAPVVANIPGKLMGLRQGTLLPQIIFSPGFRAQRVDMVNTRRGEILVVSGAEQVALYDISTPSSPRLMASDSLGARWNWRLESGELVFDAQSGTYDLADAFLVPRERSHQLECGNSKVIRHGGTEYRLTRAGIQIRNSRNCPEESLCVREATDLVSCANHLVVATPVGLLVFQYGADSPVGTFGLPKPQFLGGTSILPRDQLIVRSGDRTVILDFRSPSEPKVVADFKETPAWMSLAIGERAAARICENGVCVEVLARGATTEWTGSVGVNKPSGNHCRNDCSERGRGTASAN
jgi:hypothetical protein